MSKPFQLLIEKIYKKFKTDTAGMLIITGVIGWGLSSLAQIGAVLFNNKISNKQKSFLIPQECADAFANIGLFFLVTQVMKKGTAKLFSTGKIAPKQVRTYLQKNKELYGNKVGKLDFKLDDVLKADANFPKEAYYSCKNLGTTLATICGGIISSNIITPVVRNNMAANMQKNYIIKKQADISNIQAPNNQSVSFKATPKIYAYSNSLKI